MMAFHSSISALLLFFLLFVSLSLPSLSLPRVLSQSEEDSSPVDPTSAFIDSSLSADSDFNVDHVCTQTTKECNNLSGCKKHGCGCVCEMGACTKRCTNKMNGQTLFWKHKCRPEAPTDCKWETADPQEMASNRLQNNNNAMA